MKESLVPRRRFLQAATAATALPFLTPYSTRQTSAADRRSLSPTEFRERMRGPVLSIPTPFTREYAIDHQAIRNMVTGAADVGVKIFALTHGNGQYAYLTDEEILELTRTLEAVGNQGITIAAAPGGWTAQVANYARFAASVGADAVQIVRPERCDDESVVEHYRIVADACGLPIVLYGDFPSDLLEKLVEVPAVSALKEDVTLNYYIDRQRRFGDRLAIFGGGTESRFLVAQPYGSNCYYSAYTAFAPQAAMDFWKRVQSGDQLGAYAWVNKFDYPFLDRWSHAFWRASIEHFRIGQRYLRPPQRSFTDEQMKGVSSLYDELGLTPT